MGWRTFRPAGAALVLIATFTWIQAAAVRSADQAHVLVEDFAFQPQHVAIVAGESVTWTIGTDPDQHTVTPRDEAAFEDSGQLFQGDTFTVTFDEPGTVEYFCRLHPAMIGTVVVSAGTIASAAVGTPLGPTPAPTRDAPARSSDGSDGTPAGSDIGPNLAILVAAGVVGLGLIALLRRLGRPRA